MRFYSYVQFHFYNEEMCRIHVGSSQAFYSLKKKYMERVGMLALIL